MAEVEAEPNVSPLKNLAINGRDLLEIGVEAGPKVGEVLRSLHEMVLDDPSLNKKKRLLKLAKEKIAN